MKRISVLSIVIPLLIVQTARAQITFIPGPPSGVQQAPERIAIADFNRDGLADVAVTDTTSGLVSILLGGVDGALHSQADIALGHPPSGIAAGDLNCDGTPDLAVVDSVDDQLFVLMGNGDGTFTHAVAFSTGSHPVDVVIGHFDGPNYCPTVATLNQGDAAVSVFHGIAPGALLSRRDTNVGIQPVRFKTADLNSDGSDDFVVMGSDTTGQAASVRIDFLRRRCVLRVRGVSVGPALQHP